MLEGKGNVCHEEHREERDSRVPWSQKSLFPQEMRLELGYEEWRHLNKHKEEEKVSPVWLFRQYITLHGTL